MDKQTPTQSPNKSGNLLCHYSKSNGEQVQTGSDTIQEINSEKTEGEQK